MRCIVCQKRIQSGHVHDDIWIQTSHGKLVKVPTSRFRYADRVAEGFFTCGTITGDPKGDRCIDKLRRGEFS